MKLGSLTIDSISNTETSDVLPEGKLREMSQNITSIISHAADDRAIDRLYILLEKLLTTASATQLSLQHGSVAINALCALLDKCSSASNLEVRSIVQSESICFAAFQIVVTKSENHKPKPLRRLLKTVTSLTNEHPDDSVRKSLIEKLVLVCVQAITGSDGPAAVKPCIQVLEIFLRTRIIDATMIITVFSSRIESCVSIPEIGAEAQNMSDNSERVRSAHTFISHVLDWVQYRDCIPVISRFLTTLTLSLENIDHALFPARDHNGDPLWLTPVKQCIKGHPENLVILENNVIVPLLQVNKSDTASMLDKLSMGDADVRLKLLIAQACVKVGSISSTEVLTSSLEYLDHASPAVRLAALSNVTTLPSSVILASGCTRSRLQKCIPFFHEETNARSRNEFIALMNKMCSKIKRLDKEPSILSNNVVLPDVSKESQMYMTKDERGSLFGWYFDFLISELRPTGTYQAHITALSVLRNLIMEAIVTANGHFLFAMSYHREQTSQRVLATLGTLLLGLIFDPFDDVRDISFILLEKLLECEIQALAESTSPLSQHTALRESGTPPNITSAIFNTLPKASLLLQRTGRATHADALARLLYLDIIAPHFTIASHSQMAKYVSIECEVQGDIETARNGLKIAEEKVSLHANVMALRYVILYFENQDFGAKCPKVHHLRTNYQVQWHFSRLHLFSRI